MDCKHPIANVFLQEDGNIHCGGCKKVWIPEKPKCDSCGGNPNFCLCKARKEYDKYLKGKKEEKCCDHFVKDGEAILSNPPPCLCKCHKTVEKPKAEDCENCLRSLKNGHICGAIKPDTPTEEPHSELFGREKPYTREEEREWRRALLSALEDYALSEASKKSHLSADCDDLRFRFL